MQSFFFPTINGRRLMDWQTQLCWTENGARSLMLSPNMQAIFPSTRGRFTLFILVSTIANRPPDVYTHFGFRMSNSGPVAFWAVVIHF